jgi:hypothetical protein
MKGCGCFWGHGGDGSSGVFFDDFKVGLISRKMERWRSDRALYFFGVSI